MPSGGYVTQTSIVGAFAESLGASEPAFRLLLTILAGYPLAGIYRKFIINKQQTIQHLYFAFSGITLYCFNYGFDIYHSVLSICVTYIWSHIAYNSRFLVSGNFIFHMSYLLLGYYYTESDTYDIKWTMPHCVLTLRLIGFVYDISDGKLPKEKLSNDQKETALSEIPSFLELLGFAYFPASFIVGPQYPFRRYRKFVSNEFLQYKDHTKNGLLRFSIGILYLLIRQIGSSYIPDDYLLSTEFKNYIFVKKLVILAIWGKLTLCKYVACWLLTEGALMCFGLTFAKITENGKEDWSGCTNVKVTTFETADKLGCYVQSFNVNTNQWLAIYVYKRLKFLGNRMISQALALLFLAVWHGFHSGYYVSFFFEFVVITFERQFQVIFDELTNKYQHILEIKLIQYSIFVIRKMYTVVLLGWCLVPFVCFNYKNWIEVLSNLHYFGIIFLTFWFTARFIYMQYKRLTTNKTVNDNNTDNKEKIQ